MTTPPDEVYSTKQSPEDRRRKRAEGMRRYRAEQPEKSRASDKKFYDAHRQERMDHVAAWVKRNPHKVAANARTCRLKTRYGLTVEAWNEKFEQQGRKCLICECSELPFKIPWHTDHNHATGMFRGILCRHCNTMLGMAKDNPETLRRAVAYLMASP